MRRGLILAALSWVALVIVVASVAHEVGFADGRKAERASLIRKPGLYAGPGRIPGSVGFLVHDSWGLERAIGMAELGGDTINMESGTYDMRGNVFGAEDYSEPCAIIRSDDNRAKIIYGMKLTPTPQVVANVESTGLVTVTDGTR